MCAVGRVEQRLAARRDVAVRAEHKAPYFFAEWGAAGLEGDDDLAALGFEVLRKPRDLRRLPGALAAFESDE
ncbi:hypothetical protein GCM10027298_00600 [Epidermidibacterium keratini]